MHDLNLAGDAGIGGIGHEEEQVGFTGHVEGGAERGDQAVRQVADEADRIGQQQLALVGHMHQTGFGIERGKEAVVNVGIRVGAGVEEGGFPGIGVADQ